MAKPKHKAAPQGTNLTADLQNIDKIFKNEMKASKSGCISGCLPFFSTKIPQNYKDVLTWLVNIGEAEAKNQLAGNSIDTVAISTALKLSTQYAAGTAVGGSIAKTALNAVIDGLVGAFDLNVGEVIDPAYLSAYCATNNIVIPSEIQPLLPAIAVNTPIAKAS
jgi:hypothetical protein